MFVRLLLLCGLLFIANPCSSQQVAIEWSIDTQFPSPSHHICVLQSEENLLHWIDSEKFYLTDTLATILDSNQWNLDSARFHKFVNFLPLGHLGSDGWLLTGYRSIDRSNNPDAPDEIRAFSALRLDAAGDTIWHIDYTHEVSIYGDKGLVKLEDGDYICNANQTARNGIGATPTFIRLTDAGEVVWERSYLFQADERRENRVNQLVSADDSNVMGAGTLYNYRVREDWGFAFKLSADGDTLWSRWFDPEYKDGAISDIAKLRGDRYILSGRKRYETEAGDSLGIWAVLIDVNGNEIWNKLFREIVLDNYPIINRSMELEDGNILLTCAPRYSQIAHIILLSPEGELLSIQRPGKEVLYEVDEMISGINREVLISGVRLHDRRFKPVLMKLRYSPNSVSFELPMHPSELVVSAYPNPFNAFVSISYSKLDNRLATIGIFNNLGQQVWSFTDSSPMAGNRTLGWSAVNLPSGSYYCRLASSKGMRAITLQLEK